MNTSKTEVINICRSSGPLNMHVNNTKLNQVPECKYLGSIFIWSSSKAQDRKTIKCEMRCLRKAINFTGRGRIRKYGIIKIVGTTIENKMVRSSHENGD
jgi:hypothetical protein